MLQNFANNDTIIAPATAPGMGAIAVIRISGKDAISVCSNQFEFIKGRKDRLLKDQKSHTVHFGNIVNGQRIVDEVLVTLFKGPSSYTGEDTVEISCHGSTYIQHEIIQLFLNKGVRMADAGEFTMRAFHNGKLDLSQAEAVADLIHSTSASSHELALKQMRGGFSSEIAKLREQLMNFASLIELELDFSEEDVEFADRTEMINLIHRINGVIKGLLDSFSVGNVLKHGVPVAIVGEPNVGKSTLLNALLNEERAIVSDIAGTTRDVIEDELSIKGINFRFIDTAGIRETSDQIETIGIEKTFQKIDQSAVVLYLFDASKEKVEDIQQVIDLIKERVGGQKPIFIVLNKVDQAKDLASFENSDLANQLFISAKEKKNIEAIKDALYQSVIDQKTRQGDVIVSNNRHFDALNRAHQSLQNVLEAINHQVPSDLMAIDIRSALHSLGEITGEITTDDLLGNIFSKFCIGK